METHDAFDESEDRSPTPETLPPDEDDFTIGDTVVPKFVPVLSNDLEHKITTKEPRLISRLSWSRGEQALKFDSVEGQYLRGYFKRADA